tara:strand:- start:175 stop:1263 length:1089 start_codon:yes stop_codon:yes gene_type:complete
MRYANKDVALATPNITYQYATVKGKHVLRETPAGRKNLKATFFETPDRHIGGLSINFFTENTGNLHPSGAVSLWGKEVESLLDFIDTMRKAKIPGAGRLAIEPGAMDHSHFVSDSDVSAALRNKPELLQEILNNPDLDKDVKAIGYWRNSLDEFEKLLNDSSHFDSRKLLTSRNSAEQVWQDFFEKNKWIFGYGLLYISTVGVLDEKLEQSLQSGSIFGSGSRPDAVMRTRGALSALCLAEIKTHTAPLLTNEKRGGSYLISKELNDAVSQCQTSISVAEERINQYFQPMDKQGFPVSDAIFSYRPRSILVIGNLSEFTNQNGFSVERFRTFEMYRRNLVSPEIITYDELYGRANSLINEKS